MVDTYRREMDSATPDRTVNWRYRPAAAGKPTARRWSCREPEIRATPDRRSEGETPPGGYGWGMEMRVCRVVGVRRAHCVRGGGGSEPG
jgi:hypothetical protein